MTAAGHLDVLELPTQSRPTAPHFCRGFWQHQIGIDPAQQQRMVCQQQPAVGHVARHHRRDAHVVGGVAEDPAELADLGGLLAHVAVGGGDDDDSIYGHTGDDLLAGEDGADLLVGGTGNDSLSGGAGNDSLMGGYGNDSLRGGAGTDDLDGNAGNDTIHADDDDAADFVNGGSGDDLLWLGAGDTASGGDGADAFHLSGPTTITDFDPASDSLHVLYDPATHPDPQMTTALDGGDTIILLDGAEVARLIGVAEFDATGITLTPQG